jgi:excisionase family DNA binding protein
MEQFLTPPRIAKILGTGTEQVHKFIERGELKAINTSLGDRPRWKIRKADFDSFCESRMNRKPSEAPKRRSIPKPGKDYV